MADVRGSTETEAGEGKVGALELEVWAAVEVL
jgi:hypothetical protein